MCYMFSVVFFLRSLIMDTHTSWFWNKYAFTWLLNIRELSIWRIKKMYLIAIRSASELIFFLQQPKFQFQIEDLFSGGFCRNNIVTQWGGIESFQIGGGEDFYYFHYFYFICRNFCDCNKFGGSHTPPLWHNNKLGTCFSKESS